MLVSGCRGDTQCFCSVMSLDRKSVRPNIDATSENTREVSRPLPVSGVGPELQEMIEHQPSCFLLSINQ